jgi:hypothetical protein
MEQNRGSGWVAPFVSGELGADDPLDIFQENKSWSASGDTIEDGREDVTRIGVSVALSST